MSTFSLLVALCTVIGQGQKPLYQEIGIVPNGRNGYEEYLAAADICRQGDLTDLLLRVDNRKIEATDDEGNAIELSKEKKRINDLTVLEAKQEIGRKFGKVISLIELGNAKDVSQPRESISFDTLLPELTYFRRVSRVMSTCAELAYVNGKPKEAGKILQNQLLYSDNIGRTGPIIMVLVSYGNTAIALSTLEKQLFRMSLPEIRAVTLTVTELLRKDPIIKSGLRKEFEYNDTSLLLEDPVKFLHSEDDDFSTKKVIDQISQLDKAGKQRLGQELTFLRNQHQEKLLAVLDKPPLSWLESEEPPTTEDLASKLVRLTSPVFGQAFVASARFNVQLRLLRAHMAILEYRWEYGVLPPDLSVLDRDVFIDPLNSEFVYVQNGQGYRLYSKGHPRIGEIELRYRNDRANLDREINP